MNEEQLKPINEQENELKEIALPKQISEEPKKTEVQSATINSLPSWSIEPPVEIKRGN